MPNLSSRKPPVFPDPVQEALKRLASIDRNLGCLVKLALGWLGATVASAILWLQRSS
jgi:hypothetical protein